MITLITGSPGTGKSALIIQMMLEALKAQRPVFQHGLRDLSLDVQAIFCGSTACEFCAGKEGNLIDDFKQWAPPNSFIVLDEVQRQYRARGSSAPVPKAVQDFETHRHNGLDFVVATQSPGLIDQNIRKLVAVHHNLKRRPIGSVKYTWLYCNNDPQKLGDGESKTFIVPSDSFKYYKSAELHTKVRKPIPKALILMVGALAVAGACSYIAYDKLHQKFTPIAQTVSDSADFVGLTSSDTPPPQDIVANKMANMNTSGQLFDLEPLVEGVLESAPAYDGLVRYSDFPRVAGCIASATRCTCYTQQATIYPTKRAFCKAYISGKQNAFNPYITYASAPTQSSPALDSDTQ